MNLPLPFLIPDYWHSDQRNDLTKRGLPCGRGGKATSTFPSSLVVRVRTDAMRNSNCGEVSDRLRCRRLTTSGLFLPSLMCFGYCHRRHAVHKMFFLQPQL